MHEMKRRDFIALFSGVIGSITLASCSKKVEYSNDTTGETEDAVGEEKTDQYSSDTTGETTQADNGQEKTKDVDNRSIEIVESGWTSSERKTIYSVTLHNQSNIAECAFPQITVTGKDEAGKILFAEKQTFKFMRPNDTYTYAGTVRSEAMPATIEFSTSTDEKKWFENKTAESSPPYTFENTNEVSGEFYTSFTGEMIINKTWKDVSLACVSAVLRDDAGNMLGGYSTFVNNLGGEGTKLPVEIKTPMDDVPAHASFELYGMPW